MMTERERVLTLLAGGRPDRVPWFGDLEVERWAEWRGGGQTVFWGGLPGVYFTDKVPETEFERHVRAVLRVMISSPRYVLGVADQVPPDGLESRVRRVAELVEEYGRY
ncbi:MAG: hypothetical protein NT006_04145 [Candidatus Aminicenantes bacterium]|nr:hypothetical protein [Candidatus Aminicenantes bacterium]